MELLNPERALSIATHDALPKSWEDPAPSNPRAKESLTRIWLAAQAVWGHKWTATQGDLPIGDDRELTVAGNVWANGLRGITERQVLEAFDRMAKLGQEWPPNLPELRKAAAGLPSFEEVNSQLLTTGSERSQFAVLVWSYIDAFQHRHARAEEAKRMRREAYERAAEHVLQGGALPGPIAGAVEHQQEPLIPQGIPTTREGRVEHLRHVLGQAFSERAATRDLHEAEKATQQRHVSPVEEFEL